MRSTKIVALGAVLTLSVFSGVLYTSCSKDSCKGVTCLNYGTCTGGTCSCKTGIGGNNCETVYRKLYAATYKGSSSYSTPTYGISGVDTNNTMEFVPVDDTSDYTKMQLNLTTPGMKVVTMNIKLTTSSANGSNFEILQTPFDTFVYSGNGSVNTTTASATVIKTRLSGVQTVVLLHDLNRQ